MSKVYLTDTFVRTAICPKGKQQELHWDSPTDINGRVRDGAVNGLGLRITPSGQKAFVHAYRFNGRRQRQVLGDTSTLNVAAARLKVQKRLLELGQGIDPGATAIDYRRAHSITLREIIDQYFTGHMARLSLGHQQRFRALVAPWVLPRSPNAKGGPRRGKITPFAAAHADMPATAITPRVIATFIEGIASDYQANTALQHLKALFNWAIRMQLVDMRNPCDPISRRKVVRKRRDYTPEQIKQIAG